MPIMVRKVKSIDLSDNGQWTMDNGQWTMDNGQWIMDNKLMQNNVILDKSFEFSVRIVKLKKYLNKCKQERIMANQLLRSGTSIGANVTEADQAQSKADFISKMCIANKEAHETRYWIRLLHETDYINDEEYSSIFEDCQELIRLLQAIIKSAKKKLTNNIIINNDNR